MKNHLQAYKDILKIFNNISNLEYTLALLNWDQSTYIPKKGHNSRSETIETITKIAHDLLISDNFYNQLCSISEKDHFNYLNDFQQKEIIKIKNDVEKARKIPSELASEIAKTTSMGMAVWQEAKTNNDDKDFLPILDKIFQLKNKYADLIGYNDNPYDALLDDFDKGLKYSYINPLFNLLENELSLILNKIIQNDKKINDNFLYKKYDTKKQWDFGINIIKQIGIDFDSFRQDTSAHPFTTNLGIGDIRITTNISEDNFKNGFFSTIHEAGHALYEISVKNNLSKSPFAHLDSLSLHESQSRFYENIIGRSLIFWEKYFPELQNIFPDQLKSVSLENFYKAINKVENNPIRIESDEVTYNLHIILRTQIENSLINNQIKATDINEIWNEKTKKIFGFYPKSKKQGYLQDIHWSDGLIGYFPTYTLGNLISAQFYYTMQKENSPLDKINKETFKKIFNWFNSNIYNKGSQYLSMDLVQKVTGEKLDSKYFIKYLKEKFC